MSGRGPWRAVLAGLLVAAVAFAWWATRPDRRDRLESLAEAHGGLGIESRLLGGPEGSDLYLPPDLQRSGQRAIRLHVRGAFDRGRYGAGSGDQARFQAGGGLEDQRFEFPAGDLVTYQFDILGPDGWIRVDTFVDDVLVDSRLTRVPYGSLSLRLHLGPPPAGSSVPGR